jgi:hypothetical protein
MPARLFMNTAVPPAPVLKTSGYKSSKLGPLEAIFDLKPGLIGAHGPTIGYHTRMTEKDWVHPTRENFQYAVALLQEGRPKSVERAIEVLSLLLPLQDVREESKTHGLWSWYYEEPLDKMNPPDWNWAGFCGLQIGLALVKFPELLPADLRGRMESALDHCARSIIRRNIKAHYTNIAYLSATVALAAGNVLNRPEYVLYGREMLEQIEESLDHHGNYNEYNSPTYTLLLIQFCESILAVATDGRALELGEKLRCRTWEIIAAYFHPATAQWAGPQSRSYSTWLDASLIQEISNRVGQELPSRSSISTTGHPPVPSVVDALPCPPEIARRFRSLPKEEFELTQRFIRRENDSKSLRGTTWFSHDACLGSINEESFWTQRRLVLGYWRTEDDLAVQLRLRFLHDGRDFVSAWATNRQAGRRVLTGVSFLIENGDYHPVFYFPQNSEFIAEDFRLRYELLGENVAGRQIPDGRFELRAGNIRALIHPLAGSFFGRPVSWQLTKIEGGMALDGVCYSGIPRVFPFKEKTPSYLALGLDLLRSDEANPAVRPHELRIDEAAQSTVTWGLPDAALDVAFTAHTHLQP